MRMTAFPNTPQHRIGRIEHGRRPQTRGVVLHTTESDPGSLRGIRNYFATSSPDGVGAHLGVDTDGTCEQWADLDDRCYHAVGANSSYIGIEQIGRAHKTTVAQWRKRRRQRKIVANRVGWVCYHWHLGQPTRGRNVFGHYQFPQGGHTDPGPRYQWNLTMLAARRAYRKLVASKGRKWA